MFINLHCHSSFSFDSLNKIDKMVEFVKKDGADSLALTDHGNMNGVIQFYKSCKKAGIKPILGCELYVCKPGFEASSKSSENKTLNHLVVLAKNKTGYANLLKLMKIGAENFYYRPRIDESILFAHSEGLVVINGHHTTSLHDNLFFNYNALTDCKSIDCCRQYLYPDYEERFLGIADRYRGIFGDDFYVECQLFDKKDMGQQAASYILYELASKHGFKAVGTGDAHYITSVDARFHKAFCAIKQNAKIGDLPNIGYFNSGKYGLITNKIAQECYPQPLIDATIEIADKIEEYDITHKEVIPTFPGVEDQHEELSRICLERIKELNLSQEYVDRFNYEMGIIKTGNLAGYFLIISDIIRWAEAQDILVNISRGSSGGSLVAMLSKIVKIDPIKHNLLFERFYSPDRAAFGDIPDIDSDFQASRREEVIDYVKHKYGHDKVSGVVTLSTLQGKNAVKDVLRIYSVCDFNQMNKITEAIPARDKISDKMADFKEDTGSDSIILYCLMEEPDLLKDYCTIDENGKLQGEYAEYFEIAIGLEGAIKSESKHASAIIISDKVIADVAPLIRDKSSNDLLVGLDMNSFGSAGLLKLDILGLKSLDRLSEVNNLLEEIGLLNE